jgi:hypothetical protein
MVTTMTNDLEVLRWQQDLWVRIIRAAMSGTPDRVQLDWHPSLARPAVSKYSATSPALLRWFDKWNANKPDEAQVRPFGFLLEFTLRKGLFAKWREEAVEGTERGRPKREDLRPIAPYDTDQTRAIENVFDRVAGQPIDSELLKTYTECLADYHLSPESKFGNGDYHDRGRTERRRIRLVTVVRSIRSSALYRNSLLRERDFCWIRLHHTE